jgi:hypothetical protein
MNILKAECKLSDSPSVNSSVAAEQQAHHSTDIQHYILCTLQVLFIILSITLAALLLDLMPKFCQCNKVNENTVMKFIIYAETLGY